MVLCVGIGLIEISVFNFYLIATCNRIFGVLGSNKDFKLNFHFQKRSKGQIILDLVFQHLELIEKDYFGLQFSENASDSMVSDHSNHFYDNCLLYLSVIGINLYKKL